MALTIAAETRRVDSYFINPFDIHMDGTARGRHIPPTDQEIMSLAASMKTIGQIEPVECRLGVNKEPILTLGFTRVAAARLIRAGFEFEGESYLDAEYMVKTVFVATNALTSLIRNITENRERNETSIIDDVYNWHKLLDSHGKTYGEVAQLYRCSVSHITKHLLLLGLSPELQMDVHKKVLSVEAALTLARDVSEADRPAIIEAAKSRGKGTATAVAINAELREIARQKKQANDLPEGILEDKPGHVPTVNTQADVADRVRSIPMKDIRAMVKRMLEDGNPKVACFGRHLEGFLKGEVTQEVLIDKIEEELL